LVQACKTIVFLATWVAFPFTYTVIMGEFLSRKSV